MPSACPCAEPPNKREGKAATALPHTERVRRGSRRVALHGAANHPCRPRPDNRRRPDAANAGEPTVRLLRCQAPRLCAARSGDSWFGAHTTPPFWLMRRRSSCAMRLAFAPMVSNAVSIDPDILRYGGERFGQIARSVNELATCCRSPTPRGSPDKREVSKSDSIQLHRGMSES